MGQTVYADLYFLINFSMDFLCFYITARLMSARISALRMAISATFGGIYAVLALFIDTDRILALFIDGAACAIMCLIAFYRKKELRQALLLIPVYIAVSMVLGGAMTALFNLFDRLDLPLPEGGDGISVWIFALLAILSGVFTLLGGRFFARRATVRRAEVTVENGGNRVTVRALCDTGNLLREPISNLPCIMIDERFLHGIIPDDVLRAIEARELDALSSLSPPSMKRTRVIPARGAVGEDILIGYRPDTVKVDGGRGARTVSAYIVAGKLLKSADGEGAIIPPELL